ncbi:MAG: hypothetical protein QME05_06425 [Candidatus Margulisbacteria bacterium]|nr:hypothetical protein [Candidatus Margulisiibacteriota bacterium]
MKSIGICWGGLFLAFFLSLSLAGTALADLPDDTALMNKAKSEFTKRINKGVAKAEFVESYWDYGKNEISRDKKYIYYEKTAYRTLYITSVPDASGAYAKYIVNMTYVKQDGEWTFKKASVREKEVLGAAKISDAVLKNLVVESMTAGHSWFSMPFKVYRILDIKIDSSQMVQRSDEIIFDVIATIQRGDGNSLYTEKEVIKADFLKKDGSWQYRFADSKSKKTLDKKLLTKGEIAALLAQQNLERDGFAKVYQPGETTAADNLQGKPEPQELITAVIKALAAGEDSFNAVLALSKAGKTVQKGSILMKPEWIDWQGFEWIDDNTCYALIEIRYKAYGMEAGKIWLSNLQQWSGITFKKKDGGGYTAVKSELVGERKINGKTKQKAMKATYY